jgi:hypothetical protein
MVNFSIRIIYLIVECGLNDFFEQQSRAFYVKTQKN